VDLYASLGIGRASIYSSRKCLKTQLVFANRCARNDSEASARRTPDGGGHSADSADRSATVVAMQLK